MQNSQDKSSQILHPVDLANFSSICKRVMEVEEIKLWKDLAYALGMEPTTLSTYKRAAENPKNVGPDRQLPLKAFVDWAIKRNISIDWLLTGQPPKESTKTEPAPHTSEKEVMDYDLIVTDLDAEYDKVAAAAIDMINMTRGMHETIKSLLMKQLKSCSLIQSHIETLEKEEQERTTLIAVSKTENQAEKID